MTEHEMDSRDEGASIHLAGLTNLLVTGRAETLALKELLVAGVEETKNAG